MTDRIEIPPGEWPGPGWRYVGTNRLGYDVFWHEEPPLSRVHELARMRSVDLRALYLRMTMDGPAGHSSATDAAIVIWDRDQLITAIRDLEDPYRLAMGEEAPHERAG